MVSWWVIVESNLATICYSRLFGSIKISQLFGSMKIPQLFGPLNNKAKSLQKNQFVYVRPNIYGPSGPSGRSISRFL